METPQRSGKNIDENNIKLGNHGNRTSFCPPETPLLRKIGYGTGVGVFHMDRTLAGKSPKSPWALKKLSKTTKDDSCAKNLQREANILRQLNHPNVVGYRSYGETKDGRGVLAMEECTISLGDMLDERYLMKKNMFSAEEINTVITSVAEALRYLHDEIYIMHGDIKSYNILLKDDFKVVKLSDFGVSLKIDKNGIALEQYIGTPSWSAPEVINYHDVITTKADIFSLGLIIYEMIALKPPHFDEEELNDSYYSSDSELDSFTETYNSEQNYGKRPVLPDITFKKEYDTILKVYKLCTEQDPNDRPSAKDLIQMLKVGMG